MLKLSDLRDLGWHLGMFISIKFPGNVAAPQGITLRKYFLYTVSHLIFAFAAR